MAESEAKSNNLLVRVKEESERPSLRFNILKQKTTKIMASGPIQFSDVLLFATSWTAAHQASLFIMNSWSLPKLMAIESVMLSNYLILSSSSFPAFSLSWHQGLFKSWVFSMLAHCIRWTSSWNFSMSPSNDYSGLISFRMDWLDLLAVQGTLKSLLQHHSSKASILRCSAFFIIQLSHP